MGTSCHLEESVWHQPIEPTCTALRHIAPTEAPCSMRALVPPTPPPGGSHGCARRLQV
eukprot:COSAG01_NODE_1077_length_11839_cov_52.054093_2_plen_58_part_00